MNLYVITRKSTGYGELQTVTIKAESEIAARLEIIRFNRGTPFVDEFSDPEQSTAVLIKDETAGIVSQTFAAS